MEILPGFIVLILFLVTPPCIHGDARSDLNILVKDYFEWRMKDRPELSTNADYHKYNDVLESFSEAEFNKRKIRADTLLQELRKISNGNLDRTDKVNYDILENMLTTFLDGYEWRYYNTINPLNLLEGPQRRPSSFINGVPFYTVGDFENYMARLYRLSEQIDEIISLFRMAIDKGTAYHNVSMNLVLEQISAICPNSNYSVDCVYYEPYLDKLDNITVTQSTREEIRSRGQQAMRKLKIKYEELSTFIQNIYMPATRKNYGVVNLVQGREYYQACLKWYLSLDMTPEEVHKLGEQEVGRIQGEMKKIMKKNNFVGSVAEYFTLLKSDSRMFLNNSNEMLDEYRYMIKERIDPFISKLFNNLPNTPIIVKAMPSDGPAGRYSRATADTPYGIFYANVLRPKEFPKILMMPLTLHEASPGHHLQLSYNAKQSAPEFLSKMETSSKFKVPFAFPSYTAFTEGWALYAESLGEEMNLYKDDNELMGRYSSEMFRACRLVVDSGIHYYNWTKDQAVDYILKYTSKSPADIKIEVDRYITWPGQACSYKIGELKIKELRTTAAERLGDKFDLRDFHTSIMEGGVVPLSLLERNVNDWIEEQLKTTTESNLPPTCSAQIISSQIIVLLLISVFVFSRVI